jgi:hypothetical protein
MGIRLSPATSTWTLLSHWFRVLRLGPDAIFQISFRILAVRLLYFALLFLYKTIPSIQPGTRSRRELPPSPTRTLKKFKPMPKLIRHASCHATTTTSSPHRHHHHAQIHAGIEKRHHHLFFNSMEYLIIELLS